MLFWYSPRNEKSSLRNETTTRYWIKRASKKFALRSNRLWNYRTRQKEKEFRFAIRTAIILRITLQSESERAAEERRADPMTYPRLSTLRIHYPYVSERKNETNEIKVATVHLDEAIWRTRGQCAALGTNRRREKSGEWPSAWAYFPGSRDDTPAPSVSGAWTQHRQVRYSACWNRPNEGVTCSYSGETRGALSIRGRNERGDARGRQID